MVKLNSFNIDLQNGSASFFFQSTDVITGKATPFCQVSVPIGISDEKTAHALRREGGAVVEEFLNEVLAEVRKVR